LKLTRFIEQAVADGRLADATPVNADGLSGRIGDSDQDLLGHVRELLATANRRLDERYPRPPLQMRWSQSRPSLAFVLVKEDGHVLSIARVTR